MRDSWHVPGRWTSIGGWRIASLAFAIAGSALAGRASAQCMQWDATVAIPPVGHGYDNIHALHVFTTGGQPTLYVAVEDGVSAWQSSGWVPNGGWGFNDTVRCLCTHDDGSGPTLYAGGFFTGDDSGATLTFLAKKVGPAWVGVPALYNPPHSAGAVLALESYDDGSGPALYLGGAFPYHVGAVNSPSLVRWNGSTTSGVGGGIPPDSVTGFGEVDDLRSFDDGNGPALWVGGYFTSVGSIPTNSLAKWDGTSWTTFGAGLTYQGNPGAALAFEVFDDGGGPALYVGGVFDHVGSVAANSVARWNGTTWSALAGIPSTPSLHVHALAVHDDNSGPALYIGSGAQIGQGGTGGVVRWDGHQLHSLGSGAAWALDALASFDDGNGRGPALYAGGHTSVFGGNLRWVDLARWYGTCNHRIDPLCFGDGTFARCPCTNHGAPGRGCANSADGQGALLDHSGTLSPDTLVLDTSFEPGSSLTIFLQSQSLLPLQVSFGDGILCLEAPLRLYAKNAISGVASAPGSADPSITQRSAALGDPIAPGTARYYQAWYRDGSSLCAAGNYNVTNGLRVVW